MKNALVAAIAAVSIAAVSMPAQAATSQRVMFESGDARIVGDLYLPDDYHPGDKLPAMQIGGLGVCASAGYMAAAVA